MERKSLRHMAVNFAAAGLILGSAFTAKAPETQAQNKAFPEKAASLPSPTPPIDFEIPESIRNHRQFFTHQKPLPAFVPKPDAQYPGPDCKILKPVSYYNLEGSPMSNGEPMNPNAYTAAIPKDEYLEHGEKIGDSIKITDPNTKASALVEITDRGLMNSPSFKDKYLDVAEIVAIDMGWKERGVIMLCYELIKK